MFPLGLNTIAIKPVLRRLTQKNQNARHAMLTVAAATSMRVTGVRRASISQVSFWAKDMAHDDRRPRNPLPVQWECSPH